MEGSLIPTLLPSLLFLVKNTWQEAFKKHLRQGTSDLKVKYQITGVVDSKTLEEIESFLKS